MNRCNKCGKTTTTKACERLECRAEYGEPIKLNELAGLKMSLETSLGKIRNNLHIAIQNGQANPNAIEDVLERVKMAKAQLDYLLG